MSKDEKNKPRLRLVKTDDGLENELEGEADFKSELTSHIKKALEVQRKRETAKKKNTSYTIRCPEPMDVEYGSDYYLIRFTENIDEDLEKRLEEVFHTGVRRRSNQFYLSDYLVGRTLKLFMYLNKKQIVLQLISREESKVVYFNWGD